jgi:hypothetical protein
MAYPKETSLRFMYLFNLILCSLFIFIPQDWRVSTPSVNTLSPWKVRQPVNLFTAKVEKICSSDGGHAHR